ncbi:MAG: D-alanine--D-alanine ligase [Elusimicrobia bacterium]|nr:D-alanine--D-alanine ligase [Elusimicrobiota bacterium]
MKQLRVAVVYGGRSAEHNVSVHSAENVSELLRKAGHLPLALYISVDGKWFLKEQPLPGENGTPVLPWPGGPQPLRDENGKGIAVDVFFPIIHGPMGEDGTLQGLLELLNAPYVGCGVLASAAGMDKQLAKKLAALEGLPVLADIVLEKGRDWKEAAHAFAAKTGFPIFVKPVCLGSSVGITKVDSDDALEAAVLLAFEHDTRVMLEQGVPQAREICCGALGAGRDAKASPCAEIRPKNHKFFDYDAKYLDPEGFDLLIPAPISDAMEQGLRAMTVRFFGAIGGFGLGRVDFFLSNDGNKVYFGEINTLPGFTSHSLYPSLWKHAGADMAQVANHLVELALERKKNKDALAAPRLGR